MTIPDERGATTASWLLCRAGRHLCALALAQVVESMRLLPVETLSSAPPCVRGLCVYRGSPLPVVDVGLLLGQEATDAGRLVVIRTGGGTVALAVGSVLGVCVLPSESAQAMPPLLREAANDAVSAIGVMDSELLLFLGAARIMPEALLERLTAATAAS